MVSIRATLIVVLLATLINQTAMPTVHNNKRANRLVYRKFNTAAFFQGLANTCTHAGTAATAQTEQEKQQAACNTLASVFQTAAAMAEKSKKRTLPSVDTLSTTIKETLSFLNTLTPEEKEYLLSPNYSYLQAIAALKTEKAQTKFITQTLTHKDDGPALLHELFSLFKTIASDQLPPLFDAIQSDVIENLNLN